MNRRNLGGIGIWALGYDDGYTELWGLIANKFSSEALAPEADTIYDSGGPAFNYYNDEIYLYTISAPEQKTIQLTFEFLDLEPEYDSLWIYDGPDTTALLIGGYSGNDDPGSTHFIFQLSYHLSFHPMLELPVRDGKPFTNSILLQQSMKNPFPIRTKLHLFIPIHSPPQLKSVSKLRTHHW